MWSKFTTALGKRQNNNDNTLEQSQANVISGVLEKHPNLSMFHSAEDQLAPPDVPFPAPSPPSSPSKSGRRGMLKRLSKMPSKLESVEPPSLRLHLPKKVKSQLSLITNASQPSDNASIRMSTNTATARPSVDSVRTPATPLDHRFGSLRSILKDKHTPATGQNVRFFSRDVYKVLTPDVSSTSEPEDPPFIERLQAAGAGSASELPRMRTQVRAPLAPDLFSPVKSSSTPPMSPSTNYFGSMTPLPAPEISNIFDLSQHDLPPIPQNVGETLLDNAVEIFDGDISRDSSISHTSSQQSSASGSSRQEPTVFHSPPDKPSHDRSHSFSFGQTVFRPKPTPTEDKDKLTANALADAYPGRPPSRNRSMSDTVFHSMLRSKSPEADIQDVSSGALVVYTTPAADCEKEQQRAEPDPFRVNATTYYTPGTVLPPSPPQPTHGRKASREEDLIWSLRTQLALQQELGAQYEIDLGARDELVVTLNTRIEAMEKEGEKRKSVLRNWKKKVAELERMCRYLEDEVDSSRHESMERSVMDEASSQALRQLHRQIADLEREKGELVKQGEGFKEVHKLLDDQLKERDGEVARLREELEKREEGERRLKDGIRSAQEQIEQMGALTGDEMRLSLVQRDQAGVEERERHRQAESKWDGERVRLQSDASEREATLEAQLDEAHKALLEKEKETELLHAELEAQWKNTELTGERMNALKEEKEALQHELTAVERKMENMEIEWNEHETKLAESEAELNEACAAKEDIERERQQVEEELHAEQEHAEDLTQALQECEDRVQVFEQELKFANDNATRLESIVKQRDTDLEELAHRVVTREDETEELREQLSGLKREHEHIVAEQKRLIDELNARDSDSRTRVEAAIKDKAEADIQTSTLQERVKTLDVDVEKLRKQVHHLQQESAGKEVRISHLEKERDRLVEDAQGLNIALDSKQQELELLKRKIGVKGTAGTTPAPQKIAHHRRESSTAFNTPTVSRPDSRLSDASQTSAKSGGGKTSDTSAPMNPRLSLLGKSTRANGLNSSTNTPTTVRPTRPVDGAMGPPPARPRASIATPTTSHSRIPSGSLARSTVTKPGQASIPVAGAGMRRTSSANTSTPASASASRLGKSMVSPVVRKPATSPLLKEDDEKENAGPTADKARIPVAA